MNYTSRLFLAALTVAITAVFTSCSKDDDDSSPSSAPAPVITAKSNSQVSFTLNGTSYSWIVTATNAVNTGFSNSYSLGTPATGQYGAYIEADPMNTPLAMTIYKGTNTFTIPSDSASFSGFFPVQTYPYSIDADNGIEIVFTDAAGELWSTSDGSADQTGSTYKILENYFHTDMFGALYINVKASFSCKVYSSVGDVKTISGSGVFTYTTDY